MTRPWERIGLAGALPRDALVARANYSAAERSVDGNRVRNFDAEGP